MWRKKGRDHGIRKNGKSIRHPIDQAYLNMISPRKIWKLW